MMFRGRFEYSIDPKGRVNIPAPFRDLALKDSQESFMITNWQRCIYGYTLSEWSRIEEGFADVSGTDRDRTHFVRVFFGGAFEVSPDKQGRILVPPSLRAYAGLEKEVAIVGMLRRFEIWSRERWQAEVMAPYSEDVPLDEDLAKKLADIRI